MQDKTNIYLILDILIDPIKKNYSVSNNFAIDNECLKKVGLLLRQL